ncbi:alpha/beta-hydrolase [Penicillium malachiteum]|uniref:alpha/beta-hydrolase n=1 Tax=Penicillium malachiteum TaxID=1324776 RepID=UPI0025467FE0|nr:alpha/beta-hydrolase [Penicillium malachiteum]KAJ5736957.1 alpha/beta-hydrolase [Penicillium malachiteum]
MALEYSTVSLQVKGVKLNLSTIHYFNFNPPILFLHGFGSCKEDLADLPLHKSLQNYSFIAYDAPGCGQSTSSDLSTTDIPFLVATSEAILSHFKINEFHLIGHSMGGLTALLLANRHPDRVLSFVDIKGNLAPEDCFLSRQIFQFPSDDQDSFLNEFIDRTRKKKSFGNPLYASTLRTRVRSEAVRPIFDSMVRLSDEEDLVGIFLQLHCRKMFMFGEEYNQLPYLGRLEQDGVELASIPESGHFPMYSNPVEMYRQIGEFLHRVS